MGMNWIIGTIAIVLGWPIIEQLWAAITGAVAGG